LRSDEGSEEVGRVSLRSEEDSEEVRRVEQDSRIWTGSQDRIMNN